LKNIHKKQLTVLHIFSGDLWAGAEVMIYNLLYALKDEPDLKIVALSLNEGTLSDKLKEAGIETYIIPEKVTSFTKIIFLAYKLLKGQKIDIIHSHRYKENLLALTLCKIMNIKKNIVTLHGLPETSVNGPQKGNPVKLKTKLNYLILKWYFTNIVAVSQEMKNTLCMKYFFNADQIVVIYNGIPISDRQNDNLVYRNKEYLHIGTVGRMVPVKDFNLFLEIAAELKKVTDRVRFSILGDGPLKARLLERAKELKIEDDVEFLTPRPDPYPYYHRLDLYLNTSLHEGIPLSILEAMSCAKAVVAPNVGGIPEIISHGMEGYLVEGRGPGLFSALCSELINDKWKRNEMGKKGMKKIMKLFSDTKMANQYHNLYLNMNRISA